MIVVLVLSEEAQKRIRLVSNNSFNSYFAYPIINLSIFQDFEAEIN